MGLVTTQCYLDTEIQGHVNYFEAHHVLLQQLVLTNVEFRILKLDYVAANSHDMQPNLIPGCQFP